MGVRLRRFLIQHPTFTDHIQTMTSGRFKARVTYAWDMVEQVVRTRRSSTRFLRIRSHRIKKYYDYDRASMRLFVLSKWCDLEPYEMFEIEALLDAYPERWDAYLKAKYGDNGPDWMTHGPKT